MIEKIEKTLREGEFEIQDGGDGMFYCLKYEPSKHEEKTIWETAQLFFKDVQWCPSPETHGDEFWAVLNCFGPVERRKKMERETYMDEMEEIVREHNKLIEAIETSEGWTLFDCKYIPRGVKFVFKENNSESINDVKITKW